MVNDPIGDLLIQIKNASMAKKPVIEVPFSKLKYEVSKILSEEGYIGEIEKTGIDPKYVLRIKIKYLEGVPAITGLKRVSKPGLRWYIDAHSIPTVVGGMGIAVLSTSQGIMTGNNAKKKGIGGELLCTIW